MKSYLFYTQHETNTTGEPITALYLSPKDYFVTHGTYPDNYDKTDRAMLDMLMPALNLTEEAEWAYTTTQLTPPDIIKILTNEQNRKQFSTTDRFAQQMKDEAIL